jgi:heptosyltransferase-3
VEADFRKVSDCLPLAAAEPPPLVFSRKRTRRWHRADTLHARYAVMHPCTRWQRKRWPEDRWVAVGKSLLEQVGNLVVSCGPEPDEIAQAESLAGKIGAPAALSTRGETSWAELADLLYGARLFVGVDTAAMHLAAACNCPTVAIFGPSVPSHWAPWKTQSIVLAPPPEKYRNDMTVIQTIPAAEVMAACKTMLATESTGSTI